MENALPIKKAHQAKIAIPRFARDDGFARDGLFRHSEQSEESQPQDDRFEKGGKKNAEQEVTASYRNQRAFTLIEVLITLSILVTMVFAVSQLIRMGFDIRYALSQQSRVTHRLNVVLDAMSRDLSHAFIVSTKDTIRSGQRKRSYFKITRGGEADALFMTFMAHKALKANSKESDISYVVYELRESKKQPGLKNLYRGETLRVPSDFREYPPMAILAEDIASLKIEAWNGDDWSKDKWESDNGDTRDRLPHMVRITIQGYELSFEERDKDSKPDVQFSTSVYLPNALDFNELKTPTTSFSFKP